MVTKVVAVQNKVGFHARPASLLIDAAKKFSCAVSMEKDGKTSDLKSIITLLKMQCKFGDEVTITCKGEDEQACLDTLVGLIDSKFGEA